MKVVAKPIKMLCQTNEDGSIEPVRFKIKNEEGANVVLNIMHIQTAELQKIAGIKVRMFMCQIEINKTMRLCEIRYNQDTCKWSLHKI